MTNYEELAYNRNLKSQEFAHNRTLMNKINKTRSVLFFLYFVPMIVYIPTAFFMGFITNISVAGLDALIVIPAVGYCAWRGCYSYRDFMALLVLVILFLNQLLLMFLSPYENSMFHKFNIFHKCAVIHLVLLVICGAAAVINLKINIQYHKLEASDGFPHFNERFFDQEMDTQQSKIKDPYQDKIDRNRKYSSDEMTDIDFNDQKYKEYPKHDGPDTMDSL
ncbi:MAG: hypothetical protein K6G33_06845 [Ruminococcus sp.]|uniref:hypothetical protein n=1 Tax=Ruminococcus sp. TaxID=41978 RepID=UPI0025FB4D4B|nr:hypothetical protein [Ruminococcus sp.]MCR5600437.1 hypothetical protein [Ruminococcus sp.]